MLASADMHLRFDDDGTSYSAWQDAPAGSIIPAHPSEPGNGAGGEPEPEAHTELDFAAQSIASDIAGYRSRIFQSFSIDGVTFGAPSVVVEGGVR